MKQAAALTSFEAVLDSRDSGTYAHCQRTAKIALVLGRIMDLSHEQLLTLERGVFLHDLGKIHIADRILKKTELLQESEWKVMRGHAISGYAMVSTNPVLTEVAAIVLAHPERYDGTGYPHRLEAEEIPLGARICAIADCFDMLTATDHAYRRPCTVSEACSYIQTQRGTHFDPRIGGGIHVCFAVTMASTSRRQFTTTDAALELEQPAGIDGRDAGHRSF